MQRCPLLCISNLSLKVPVRVRPVGNRIKINNGMTEGCNVGPLGDDGDCARFQESNYADKSILKCIFEVKGINLLTCETLKKSKKQKYKTVVS